MRNRFTRILSLSAAVVSIGALLAVGPCPPLTWHTVVNNGDTPPGSARNFNSYGAPSVNGEGLVVVRGRTSGMMEPVRGVFARDMGPAGAEGPLEAIAVAGLEVPPPNNTDYNGLLAAFNEFPAFPRIDAGSPTIATRGQSQPVWTYLLPDTTETRVGTAGVYVDDGALQTAAAALGAVRDAVSGDHVFPEFQVPGAPEGTRFDQFPGAPTVTDGSIVAFKGNFTVDEVGSTGVFYRDFVADGGLAPVQLIARAGAPIPDGGGLLFGSTAPPSAANGVVAFIGSDIEEAPTAGGVYVAPLAPSPPLEVVMAIGDPVPGESPGPEATFKLFGEGVSLSSSARHVAFWGTWGSETVTRTLLCPTDGQPDLIAYCNELYPEGYTVEIPVHQGVFVCDRQAGRCVRPASTEASGFEDFLYWVFSGRPPGTGGGEEEEAEEPARWRSSAFVALSGGTGADWQLAFKARRSGKDGIYLRRGFAQGYLSLVTVLETGQPAEPLDPEAPTGSLITTLGIERDGFRNGWLAVNVGMLLEAETEEETEGWAGVYVTRVYDPEESPAPR